jgi:hypothetical protein
VGRPIETIALLAVCAGLLWVARGIEPHWSSNDGRHFIARAQLLGPGDVPEAGWKEVRGSIEGEVVRLRARGIRAARLRGDYRVATRSPAPPKGKAVFLLVGEQRIVLRLPSKSRSVPVLDELVG